MENFDNIKREIKLTILNTFEQKNQQEKISKKTRIRKTVSRKNTVFRKKKIETLSQIRIKNIKKVLKKVKISEKK